MSLQNLSDDELKEFVRDPSEFVKSRENFKKVFNLNDPTIKQRVERIQHELGPKPDKKT